MTEQEEVFLARRVAKLEGLLRESLEHTFGSIHTQDFSRCPDCGQNNKPSTQTRCDRCFDAALKAALGMNPRPF